MHASTVHNILPAGPLACCLLLLCGCCELLLSQELLRGRHLLSLCLSLCELQGLLRLHHVGLLLLEEGRLLGEEVGPEGLTGLRDPRSKGSEHEGVMKGNGRGVT